MLTEIAVLGGLVGIVVGVLELSYRLEGGPEVPLSPEAALRVAMGGPDGAAVRAEFGRSGVAPVARRHPPIQFGL
jgi:hypothetical protein